MSLGVIYSTTDIFLLAFCLIPIFTFRIILMLNVLLKQKKTKPANKYTAAVIKCVTSGFYSCNYTGSSTSFVYYMQLDCKLFKAGLLNNFTLLRCQFAFILLHKQEVFIWCYIILGVCGFIFHSVFIFALLI